MTYAAELSTLEAHFDTQWAATTPVEYENDASFKVPSNGAAYCRFWVLPGSSFTVAGMNNSQRLYRHPGIIQIDIYTPEGKGAKPALQLADQAAAIFRGKRIADVLCRAPAISRPVIEAGYHRVTLTINYQRDEIL